MSELDFKYFTYAKGTAKRYSTLVQGGLTFYQQLVSEVKDSSPSSTILTYP